MIYCGICNKQYGINDKMIVGKLVLEPKCHCKINFDSNIHTKSLLQQENEELKNKLDKINSNSRSLIEESEKISNDNNILKTREQVLLKNNKELQNQLEMLYNKYGKKDVSLDINNSKINDSEKEEIKIQTKKVKK